MVPFSAASPLALKVECYLIAFPTSYLVESIFSWPTYLLSNVCNHGSELR
jgi:hypothetical protein